MTESGSITNLGVRSSNLFPFAYKTTNIAVRGLFACDGSLEHVLAADDPNSPVTDLHGIDDGPDVSLPGMGVAGIELLGHRAGKGIDLDGVDDSR